MRFLLVFFQAIAFAYSLVDFTHSALYDIYDFVGVHEVHIAKCDVGCLIFAATWSENDTYAMNLIINDYAGLETNEDENQRKTPLTITGPGNISVINQNAVAETSFSTILLYVMELAKAPEFSYEVYDLYHIYGTTITPQSDIVTFLSAHEFSIQSAKSEQPNSATVRLAGFDNALDNNPDGCPYAFKTQNSTSFPGFTIMTKAQILLIAFENRNPIQLQPDLNYGNVRAFGVDGFYASPGWNGCTKPNNGGLQSFRAYEYVIFNEFILSDQENKFDVIVDVLLNIDTDSKLLISELDDMTDATTVRGTNEQLFAFHGTNLLRIEHENMRGNQGFLMRYSSTQHEESPEKDPNTGDSTIALALITDADVVTDPAKLAASTASIPAAADAITPPAAQFSSGQCKGSSTLIVSAEVTSSTEYLTTSSGFKATGCLLPTLLISRLL